MEGSIEREWSDRKDRFLGRGVDQFRFWVGGGKRFFFGKKKQKTFDTLVGRVRGWGLVYGEAQELTKFFWFFLFTKRTACFSAVGWDL